MRTIMDRYYMWRYIKGGYFDMTCLSPSVDPIKEILRITGYKDLKSLQKLLEVQERFEMQKDLHQRLERMFIFGFSKDLLQNPLNVEWEGRKHVIPVPFAATKSASIDFQICNFWVEVNNGEPDVSFRLALTLPGILVPATEAAEPICALLASEFDFSEPDDDQSQIIANWLKSMKLPQKLSKNSGFLEVIGWQLNDRIDDSMWVMGDFFEDGDPFFILGEVERGWGACKRRLRS